MKKLLRIILLVLSTCILVFGCFILYEEFTNFNFLAKLSEDPTLLIPVHLTLFSILSIVYTIKKFKRGSVKKSRWYMLLRISDFIFSFSLFTFCMFGGYFIMKNTFFEGEIAFEFSFFMLRIALLLTLLLFSILLFIDNLKFHKSISKTPIRDTIDTIDTISKH